jgi:hypothetical protein
MAKELCMIENNEQGKTARKYFIERERLSYESALKAPSLLEQAMATLANVMAQQSVQMAQDRSPATTLVKNLGAVASRVDEKREDDSIEILKDQGYQALPFGMVNKINGLHF